MQCRFGQSHPEQEEASLLHCDQWGQTLTPKKHQALRLNTNGIVFLLSDYLYQNDSKSFWIIVLTNKEMDKPTTEKTVPQWLSLSDDKTDARRNWRLPQNRRTRRRNDKHRDEVILRSHSSGFGEGRSSKTLTSERDPYLTTWRLIKLRSGSRRPSRMSGSPGKVLNTTGSVGSNVKPENERKTRFCGDGELEGIRFWSGIKTNKR